MVLNPLTVPHLHGKRYNPKYEEGYTQFINAVLRDSEFLQVFEPFQQQVAAYGIYNSLSQVLLKVAAPGVPDFYQGNELWDLNLVDPDNRRPIDYARRMSILDEVNAHILSEPLGFIAELLAHPEDGRIKLFLTTQLLQARQIYEDVFTYGNYQSLTVLGQFAEHIVAFARCYEGTTAIALSPRFLTTLIEPSRQPLGTEVWQDTHVILPEGIGATWKNMVTGEAGVFDNNLMVGEAFQYFPGALIMTQH